MGARAEHKARTRALLAGLTLELCLEQGFESTTVSEIAAAAGVSRRTFFRYFATKDEAFFDSQASALDGVRRHLAKGRAVGMDPLREALQVMASDLTASREAMVEQHRIIDASPELKAWQRYHDRAWEGVVRTHLTPAAGAWRANVLAGAVVGILRATLTAWCDADGEPDLGEWLERALSEL